MEVCFRVIGFVRHGFSDDYVRGSLSGVEGFIEVLPRYVDGLRGLEGFSHIIVLAFLHRTDVRGREVLLVRPRGLGRRLGIAVDELPEIGVFASDSPHRPNPIALTIVRLLQIEGGVLHVAGLDLFNGTPVLDIKPYTPSRCIEDISLPRWYRELLSRAREKGLKEI